MAGRIKYKTTTQIVRSKLSSSIGFFLCFGLTFFSNSLSAQTFTQTIRGKIVDKETQVPLIGASVIVLYSNPIIGTIADFEGNFRIEKVPVGRKNIKISYIGYEEVLLNEILVTTGKELVLNVELEESVESIKEVTVKGKKNDREPMNEMAVVSSRSFSIEQTERFAASLNDPARLALSFAGVSSQQDISNEIVIRGNSPKGLLWKIEGVEVPNPNHFSGLSGSGGGVSMLSSAVLTNSDFFTGAFPAEYGNALSGVFDLKMRNGNNEKREQSIQVGLLGLESSIEGPFSKKKKASYLINYRYSTLTIFDKFGYDFDGNLLTNFQDINFKVHIPTTKAGNFSVFAVGGISSSDLSPEKAPEDFDKKSDGHFERSKYNMGVLGVSHKFVLNEKNYLNTVVSFAGSKFGWMNGRIKKSGEVKNNYERNSEEYNVRTNVTLNSKVNARNSFRYGLIMSNLFYKLTGEDRLIISDGDSRLFQTFVQWKHKTMNQFTINSGVHLMLFALDWQYSIEPRIGIRWDFKTNQALTFGTGIHSRLESLAIYLSNEENQQNRLLKLSKAQHTVLGYEVRPFKNLSLKTEVYMQYLYDIPIQASSNFSALNLTNGYAVSNLINEGKGLNYGIEITLEKHFDDNYYLLTTVSLYNSKFKNLDGIWRNTVYNSNFITNFTAGKDFKVGKAGKANAIGFNFKVIFAGGNRYTPLDYEQSLELGYAVFQEDYSAKGMNYFRLDTRVSYRKNKPKFSWEVSADIQNTTDRENEYLRYYDYDDGELIKQYQQGIIPVLKYKVEF